MTLLSKSFCRHRHTSPHLSLCWTTALRFSTPRLFNSSSTAAIHLPLGLLLCGFHFVAILTIYSPLLIMRPDRRILWPLTKLVIGASSYTLCINRTVFPNRAGTSEENDDNVVTVVFVDYTRRRSVDENQNVLETL